MRFNPLTAVAFLLIGFVVGWFLHPRYEAVSGPESILYRIDTRSGAVKVFSLNNASVGPQLQRYDGWQLSEFTLK